MISETPTQPKRTDSEGAKPFLALSSLKSGAWYRVQPPPEEPTVAGAIGKTLVGVVIGGLAYAWGAAGLAVLIWVVSGIIGIVSLSSQKARSGIVRVFAMIGRGVGWLLGTIILAPVFLIGFTIARMLGRLAGRDPLHLRDKNAQTFWLPADDDRRTVRHIGSLYATEAATPKRGGLVLGLASIAGLLVVAEVLARSLGFGNPILYQSDPQAGFVLAPNQESHRFGGLIKINSHGMRAPEFDVKKKPGTLRVFMLGDSTLYGGSFVDQTDLYARLLDKELDSQPGVNDVEVLNVGVNGWGPFQEVGYLEKFGAYNADVAIVCLPIGDIYRGPMTIANVPFFKVDSPPNFALGEIMGHLEWRSRAMMKGVPEGEDQAENGRRGIAKYVELAEKLRATGCEVLFEVLPGEQAGMTKVPPQDELAAVEDLRAALKPLGVPVGYPVGLFQDTKPASTIYHDVCHLNPVGHHLYADYLKTRLEQESAKVLAHRASGGATPAAKEGATQ